MPGEAQKIERLMEVFSGRYVQCNPDVMTKFHSNDTVFIMAFAIILLNTDLHTPNIKVPQISKLSKSLLKVCVIVKSEEAGMKVSSNHIWIGFFLAKGL